jgi:hypothetical protein
MKNNKLMAVLMIVTAIASQSVFADTSDKDTVATVKGGIRIVNKTDSNIFVRTYALIKGCIGGCDYNRIEAGKSFTPKGSLLAGRDNLVIFAPVTSNGKAINKEVEFTAKTGEVTVTSDGSNINVEDTGTTYALSVKAQKTK